jgi:membrane protease YdiL (CAAX protease family)
VFVSAINSRIAILTEVAIKSTEQKTRKFQGQVEEKKRLLIEILVVLSLTVFRPVLTAIGRLVWLGDVVPRPFGYYFFEEIIRSSSIIILVLFVLWVKEDQWKEVGLVRPDWIADGFLGWSLLLLKLLVWIPIAFLLPQFGIFSEEPNAFLKPSAIVEYLWIILSALVTAFAEESLIRGYLISRLMRLFESWKSVLFSSVIFSVWHLSLGITGLVHTFLWGLIFGFAFTKFFRLWPLVVAHALNNIGADFLAATRT